ncbi:MAG: hypothetical protein ABSD56_03915 [Bryobacteraceae bacterium]
MESRSAALVLALSAPRGAAASGAGDRDPASLNRLWKGRRSRWRRLFEPPQLFVENPAEPHDFPLGRWNLYVGGAGARVDGYVNIDLFALPGVDVAADVERLPFRADLFTRVECDAVLEHVPHPAVGCPPDLTQTHENQEDAQHQFESLLVANGQFAPRHEPGRAAHHNRGCVDKGADHGGKPRDRPPGWQARAGTLICALPARMTSITSDVTLWGPFGPRLAGSTAVTPSAPSRLARRPTVFR